MPKLKISNRAERDLTEIGRYIAKDSPTNAFRFIQKLKKNLRILATQPMAGRARNELSPGLRSVFYGRYIIFYYVSEQSVEIAHVLHSARDIERLLKAREASGS
jgi:toxin ParE1/3/4